jgi:hypothetical protein
MTKSNDKGKKTEKGAKKLSVKKDTVKDLDSGSGKAKELGDDQLDAVNGGIGASIAQCCPASQGGERPFRRA